MSERHVYASRNKHTAGEAAKLISKKLGVKVLAAEVKSLYLTHYGYDPEWHHSGFYRGSNGKTMGRTFFLSDEEVQAIVDNYNAIIQKRAEDLHRKEEAEHRKRETKVTGFYYTWDSNYGGRYGRKQNFKVLHAYEGDELNKPSSNFTSCDPSLMPAIKAAEGRKYFGWDEPRIEEFTK